MQNTRRLQTQSAAQAVAASLRRAILNGELRPGQPLKTDCLARELGVSRTPVREGLLLLAAEGLVELIPNRWARVRSYSPGEINDIYELRALLEGHACRRAASALSSRALLKLRRSCERFAELLTRDDATALTRENMIFHNVIVDSAGSALIKDMLRTVLQLSLVHRAFWGYSSEQKLSSHHCHEQIVHALEHGDGEYAESLMRTHIYEARDVLLLILNSESDSNPELRSDRAVPR